MEEATVILFTRNGVGDAPGELQRILAVNFVGLLARAERPPRKVLFYGDGVKLACVGSPVLEPLFRLSSCGAELILCRTCLDYFGLIDQVAVGAVKGMPDILAAMLEAKKVLSV